MESTEPTAIIILDMFKGSQIDGAGETSREVSVDKYHQWISTVTMLAPSLDRMVGVANLRRLEEIGESVL